MLNNYSAKHDIKWNVQSRIQGYYVIVYYVKHHLSRHWKVSLSYKEQITTKEKLLDSQGTNKIKLKHK